MRADLLPILRAAHTANPDVIVTAETEDGKPSFKLDRIAPLNGFENHDAHDALGDCRATIHLARLVRDRAPEVWERMLENADPKRATELLENNRSCLSMTYFGKPEVHRVMRLTGSPSNPKKVALFDLAFDPEPYLSMTAADLAEAMAAVPRAIPTVKLNAMPALLSLDAAGAPAQTDAIDEETIRERIEGRPDFLDRVSEALEIRNEYPAMLAPGPPASLLVHDDPVEIGMRPVQPAGVHELIKKGRRRSRAIRLICRTAPQTDR